MAKRIKVIIEATFELPDQAEVIRFRDEEGIETDHLKFAGKLFRPGVDWLQYCTSEMMTEQFGGHPSGIGWESVVDDTLNEYLTPETMETWYMEEIDG